MHTSEKFNNILSCPFPSLVVAVDSLSVTVIDDVVVMLKSSLEESEEDMTEWMSAATLDEFIY